jgi:predicted RNA-binding protein
MCEFTVNRKSGSSTEKIGEDIIFFQYDDQGKARLADVLGRSNVIAPTSFVYEINMLENRHDILIMESEIVPHFVRFMQSLQNQDIKEQKSRAEGLISEIKKLIA